MKVATATSRVRQVEIPLSTSMASKIIFLRPTYFTTRTGVIGVTVLSGTPRPYSTPICPTDFSCPEDNGCSTTDGSRWLKLECRADYALDTVDPTTAPSIEACSQLCFKNPLCKSLTFVGGKAGGDCYLKGEKLPDTVTNYRDHTDGK
jgi:hypothetical protein